MVDTPASLMSCCWWQESREHKQGIREQKNLGKKQFLVLRSPCYSSENEEADGIKTNETQGEVSAWLNVIKFVAFHNEVS